MKKFKVKVPATSANVGSGFDSVGIAVTLYNEFIFCFEKEGLHFIGVDKRFANEKNLVYRTFCSILFKHNCEIPKAFNLEIVEQIPIARGLGSSSSCIIAGILAANEFGNLKLSKDDIIREACIMEGHPDNVVPAIVGKMVSAVITPEIVIYQQINIANEYKFYAVIEENELETAASRNILPKNYEYYDITFNIARVSMLLRAFEHGYSDQLRILTDDKIHQPYRFKTVQCYDKLKPMISCEYIVAHWLSGAGSTIMFLANKKNHNVIMNLFNGLGLNARVLPLDIDTNGSVIEYI